MSAKPEGVPEENGVVVCVGSSGTDGGLDARARSKMGVCAAVHILP